MPKCSHHGCGKEFDESNNPEGGCSYHPGGPVFHEGLKSWSCCNEINKPVMEFEAFMALPACTEGTHSAAPPPKPLSQPSSSSTSAAPSNNHITVKDGVETYSTSPLAPTPSKPKSGVFSNIETAVHAPTPPPAPPVKDEEDDLSLPVAEGTMCKRTACGMKWEGEQVSRGNGERAKCRYHPQPAIFHEGSKGYLCCKRRVLEFSEFLKIEGCTEGNHLFVGSKKDETEEEIVPCRLDHYQTPTTVHVSAFAKGADKEKSKVTFDTQQLHLDLYLPSNKRVVKSVTLYGPIEPSTSSYRILSTKVDIVLQKPQAASWPLLELPPPGSELPAGYALTFGVKGRTGTVGGKEIVLAEEEMAKRP